MARTPPLPRGSTAAILKDWWAVEPCAAKLATRLFKANGAVVSSAELQAATGQTDNGFRLSLANLRQAMDPGSIEDTFKVGYRFTEIGLADCRAALEDAARRGLGEQVAA